MIHGPALAEALDEYLTGKTVKALLVTTGHVDSADLSFRSDITYELVASGYTPGGVVAANVGVTYASGAVAISCDDLDFGTFDATGLVGLVFYVDTADPATDRLLWTDVSFAPLDTLVADGPLIYSPDPSGTMQIIAT